MQIFNSCFGPSEGEEAKRIVFYHPATDSDELKCKSVGFAEASVRFADAFFADDDNNGPEGNLRSCHTQVSLSQSDLVLFSEGAKFLSSKVAFIFDASL